VLCHVEIILQLVELKVRHRYDPVLYGYSYVSFRLQYLLLIGDTLDHARLVLNIRELHQGALCLVWTLFVGLGYPTPSHFEILHFGVR